MNKFILAFDKYIFMKELQKNIDFAEKRTKFSKNWNKDKQKGYIVALKMVLKRVNKLYKNLYPIKKYIIGKEYPSFGGKIYPQYTTKQLEKIINETNKFIRTTPDFNDYAEDILKYMKKHKALNDICIAYAIVKKINKEGKNIKHNDPPKNSHNS